MLLILVIVKYKKILIKSFTINIIKKSYFLKTYFNLKKILKISRNPRNFSIKNQK